MKQRNRSAARACYAGRKMNKADKRFLAAAERAHWAKVARITKERMVMYTYSCMTLSLHELYGFGVGRISELISASRDLWSSYTKADERKIIDKAKELGVDVAGAIGSYKYDQTDYGKSTARDLDISIQDCHICFACLLIKLHELYGFGEKRLNKALNHSWKWWLQSIEEKGNSIMDICERETGIVYEMA